MAFTQSAYILHQLRQAGPLVWVTSLLYPLTNIQVPASHRPVVIVRERRGISQEGGHLFNQRRCSRATGSTENDQGAPVF